MGTHAVNPRNIVKLGKEECHKFKARLNYTTNSRPIRVQRPCPKRNGGGEGEWRGRYHPNKNKAYCTADTRDVPTPHLSAPPTHFPGTDANKQ